MNTTRRQFVASSLASLPVLAYAADTELLAGAPAATADPALGQIEADVVQAYQELLDQPRRVDALRSFEASLRFHAAYATASNLDANIKKALRAKVKARGKALWIDDLAADQHHAHRRIDEIRKRDPHLKLDSRLSEFRPVFREDVEKVLDEVLKNGTAPILHRAAGEVRRLRERAAAEQPAGLVRAAARGDFCDEVKFIVQALEMMVSVVCALSMLNPALIPECAVLAIELGVMQMIQFAFCEWI